MFILKKSDPQLGLALQSCVVTFENVALLYFISFFISLGLFYHKERQKNVPPSHHDVLSAFLPDSTRRSALLSPLLQSFLIGSCSKVPGAGWMDGHLQQALPFTEVLLGLGSLLRAKGGFVLRLPNSWLWRGCGCTSNAVM